MTDQNWNKRISNPQTTKIFTPALTDGINQMVLNKDLILPVINAVEDENILIRNQIAKFSHQFKKLDALTSSLLAENLRMRSHYSQRTNDLQCFIETMKINLGSQICDITHQSHLLREGNCLLFKNIQAQMNNTKEYDERIEQMREKLIQMKQNNTYQEEHVLYPLRVRLQNKLNSNTIRNLSQKQEKLNLNEQKLWAEVANLVLVANQIERENIQNSKNGWIQKNDNKIDKEHYKNNIIQALKSLNQLKLDLQAENAVANTQNQIYKGLAEKLNDLEAIKKKKNSQKQQKILQLNKLRALREYQTKDFYQTRKIVSQMEVQVMKRNEQKQRLAKILQNKKRANQNMKQKHDQQKKAIEEKGIKQVEEVRRKLKQVQVKFDQQMEQANQAMQAAQSMAQGLNNELKQLSNDYEYYSKMCMTVQNPVKQIERAQFKLKYALKNRRQ